MFVRTEWNDTVEIYNDDEVNVKPRGNKQWLLFVVDDDDDADFPISCDKVKEGWKHGRQVFPIL